jgi:predicted MFS family arabinose efflux permease
VPGGMAASSPPPAPPLRSTARVPRRVLAAILLGTLLNPLNSSMIAVALAPIQDDFGAGVVAAAWLISSYYLMGAVAQGVLGRLADQFGPRRLICAGFVVVAAAGALAPLAPSFGWVVAARVALALGTSAAFPAGLAILRDQAGGTPPPSTLAPLTIAGSVSAALGPVLGGALVALWDWPAIFVVNVAVALVGLVLALRWLPRDPQHAGGIDLALVRRLVDLPGIALFAALVAGLLALLLSLPTAPLWWLAPLALAAAGALVAWERRRAEPFLDVRMLAGNRALLAVYAQYAAVNVAFFGVFFSVPLWLERVRGFSPGTAGLLILPIAGVGVISTPLAARLIARRGIRAALVTGSLALIAGTLLMLVFDATTALIVVVVVGAVLGIPNGFNNLGLQSALYGAAEPERTGAAAGLFQTFRYVGAVLSTSLIGIVFAGGVDTAGLHEIALVLAGVGVAVLAASAARPR